MGAPATQSLEEYAKDKATLDEILTDANTPVDDPTDEKAEV